MEKKEQLNDKEKKQRRKERLARWRSNPAWVIFVFVGVYIFLTSFLYLPWWFMLNPALPYLSDEVYYVLDFYTCVIVDVFSLFLLTWLIRPNRYIWKSFLLPKKRSAAETTEDDLLADFYGRRRNGLKMLGWGFLLGFLQNFFCIICALIHGDIQLYFESGAGQIPLFLFAFLSVFIQSSSEELWCRGFLYERLHERCPLWVVIFVNGALFGCLHIFNDGVTVLSIVEITVCGIAFSLLRWYTGSIWIVMGLHTAWNFTQAFLFGLPNSGLVSAVSLFHLESSTGISNLIYDYDFGVEGALPALVVDLLMAVIILVLSAKSGRLKELKMNRAATLRLSH